MKLFYVIAKKNRTMKKRNFHSPKNAFYKSKQQAQDTKEKREKQLHKILFERPITRRMAATQMGYPDQTYMVTQLIFDLIKSGRVQVVGKMKCERSPRIVEAITSNPEYFRKKDDNRVIL